jgi:transposase
MSSSPDVTLILAVRGNCSCGQCLDSTVVTSHIRRQIYDLPEVQLIITEYQAETKICPACQKTNQACFPIEAAARVQYGSRVHGLATYLNVAHFIPFERTSEIINVLCGADLSDGTIDSSLKVAANELLGFETNLKAGLEKQAVLNADETGCKIAGKLNWIHVLSCEMLTFYAHHQKRGYAAIEYMGVLPTYKGTVMHDAWSTYFRLLAIHALCNAHLLRELRALAEHYQQVWAGELRVALQGVYHAYKGGLLTEHNKTMFLTRFDELLEMGLTANPVQPRGLSKRGRVAQSKGRNLALRCKQHKDAVLRFLLDARVPFDNNLAERDIRMVCVKRKVSGGFRSAEGAAAFCRIRSYISTLKKQGMNVWDGLVSVFRGVTIMPKFIC